MGSQHRPERETAGPMAWLPAKRRVLVGHSCGRLHILVFLAGFALSWCSAWVQSRFQMRRVLGEGGGHGVRQLGNLEGRAVFPVWLERLRRFVPSSRGVRLNESEHAAHVAREVRLDECTRLPRSTVERVHLFSAIGGV